VYNIFNTVIELLESILCQVKQKTMKLHIWWFSAKHTVCLVWSQNNGVDFPEFTTSLCYVLLFKCRFYQFSFLNSHISTIFILLLDESLGYIGILMSVLHTFGFRIIIKVPLSQIFSNFHTLLCTITYRLSLITVYFTFTVWEKWTGVTITYER
jgi:hypothetical protein